MARTAVESMSRCQGHLFTSVGRALDDPELWLITSVWDSVGAYRRALSSYDVKVAASSLLASAVDDVNVFETLLEVSQNGTVEGTSSLSEDPGR
jgi:hypothetical protein